jgi:SAM-dependent methyltransferase
LIAELPVSNLKSPLQVLELGAGIGTMVERLIDWGLLSNAAYTIVDTDSEVILQARQRLKCRAAKNQATTGRLSLEFICKDIFQFFKQTTAERQWDLGLAHAFLDLVDITDLIPYFCGAVRPGGFLYLTLNYDGETILLPAVDTIFDERIMQLYNQSMDARIINGKAAGDSKTGRRLLLQLKNAGVDIVAAGSSDWIVFPGIEGYTADEAYFLHFIIDTIFKELKAQASLDQARLDAWTRQRHRQIENNELIFIAKQIDVLARITF